MKCLSLWQPWASLIAIGAKKIETRSWSTSYRGPLLIHASKNKSAIAVADTEPFHSSLTRGGVQNLPLGVIVCRCELVDCLRIAAGATPGKGIDPFHLDHPERLFGDYSFGRYGWVLEKVVRFDHAIPYTGRQGLFEVPDVIVPA